MIQAGIVTGREIKKNKDGEKPVILLQCEITDPDDIQTIELMNQSGEDNNPPNGSRIVIVDIGQAYKIAIASDDSIEPETDPGEKKIYSTDQEGTEIKAYILLGSDGVLRFDGDEIVIKDDTDNAVRYSELETAFNQLKSDFDNFVTTVFNVHTHTGNLGNPTSGPLSPGSVSTADITKAKIVDIKVPGVST